MADPSDPADPIDLEPSPRTSGMWARDLVSQLINVGAEDRARDERQTTTTIKGLLGVIGLLVVVLAMIVTGLVGVGVTGKIPGIGELTITREGETAGVGEIEAAEAVASPEPEVRAKAKTKSKVRVDVVDTAM